MRTVRELTFMRDLRCLPLLRDGVISRYEGSIDKAGGNADWDWSLYRDERGEWVLFDHQGAGCVYNFVQHRYPDSPEPTFRFYFDGEEEPRFVIRHSQFGEVYPFIEPLAGRYIGPIDGGPSGWRAASYPCPMPKAAKSPATSSWRAAGESAAKAAGAT